MTNNRFVKYLKIILYIFNTVSWSFLFLLLLTLIDNQGYFDLVISQPILFSTLFMVLIKIISYILIIYILLSVTGIQKSAPIYMLLVSFIFFYIAYQQHPIVKRDNMYYNMIESNRVVKYVRTKLKLDDHKYNKYLLHEAEMLRDMYASQYTFLNQSIQLKDPRNMRQTYVFALLGLILLVNAMWVLFKKRIEAENR